MVRLNTYESMDTKKDDTLKTVKTKSPKNDLYDYEVPDWAKKEWGKAWCKWSYKPWIYGDKK